VALTNANGATTTYVYDALDRLVSETNALGASTAYSYDNLNRLTERTDAEGRVTAYTYDAKSRMRRAEYWEADAPTPYRTNLYTYDGAGNLVAMSNEDVRLAYVYDALDQRERIDMWTPTWGMTRTLTLNRDDPAGNLTQVTGPEGYQLLYAYDNLNRVRQVTDPAGTATSYQYDSGGRPTAITYADGTVAAYSYDPMNRLTGLSYVTGDDEDPAYTYGYDSRGNLITEVDQGEVYTYTYDAVGRVVTSTGEAEGGTGYSYDPVGNRLSADTSETSTAFTYDAANRLLQAGDATFGYDTMGARTQVDRTAAPAAAASAPSGGIGGAAASFDPAAPAQPSATVSYAYDNDMRLIEVQDGTQAHRYIYDPLGNLIGYVDADGGYHYYLRDGEDIYLELDGAGAVVATYTLGAQGVVSMWRGGVRYLFLYDGRGRVRHVIDLATAAIVHRYGRALLSSGYGLPSFYNPIRIRGAWWFPGVYLVHFGGGVFWDPWFGVFLAKAWPWLYWPFGPFHPWRPIFRFWPWPWPWPRPWGWPWPRPWGFLWPWPGAWVRPWLIWPIWPWGLRFWWPWWYWRWWWGWTWWGRWWCWHPWWWWGKWWWWPWWHPWWWWPYWWWPWWWWTPCWWWPWHWWWWIWWAPWWWFWWPGRFWWCWWWWWPWPWWWWMWWWPPAIGPPPDYGDAPDPPYASYARSGGAVHGWWWYEWLGADRDGEWDSEQIDRDLYDDGVSADAVAGTVSFTPTVAYPTWPARYSAAAQIHVHGWVDWNGDGDWTDTGEMIVNWSDYPGRPGGPWPVGQQSLRVTEPFAVPAGAFAAGDVVDLWMRFRLDYAANWESPTGYTTFGEVEDHKLTVVRARPPAWNGLVVPLNYAPVITYPTVVSGVRVSIQPAVPITAVWTTVTRLAAGTGNMLRIEHTPFTVGETYTVTLGGGTTPGGGYVTPASFTLTAGKVRILMPLVMRESGGP
jgi:YD repeat-containing protein